ncbi:MAG: alkylphosphonate utilization protein [Bacteroidia bacterium]|nr:alkylphosphonate utilization protein [Bacteroidia bacterium]
MRQLPPCPKCKSEYVYESDNLLICPECFYEWNAEDEAIETTNTNEVIDSNGNVLSNGDTIVIIKDLPVKGYQKAVKTGTKVKNIRLTDGSDGHNIDCKVEGFGALGLKSEFVRKA